MPRLRFEQLVEVYRHTVFDPSGDEGLLSIASSDVLATLQVIEADDQAAYDANLAVLAEPTALALGGHVRIRASAPRLALGLLVRTFDDLLNAPEGRIAEPRAYYVIEGEVTRASSPPPPVLVAYRKVLELVALFTEAASYLDRTRQELVFFREGKFAVPVRFSATAITHLSTSEADKLLENFKDDVHKEQKLAILGEAIIHLCESVSANNRFEYLLANLDEIVDQVRNGYRLFASNFSYAKIRNELESAKFEYVGKIHKTLIDVQGQLLGIPVATIVVASQFKAANGCGVELWTNIAVLSGAWIFLGLLIIALINQWSALDSIGVEIGGQKRKLSDDYAAISEQFIDIFEGLSTRIILHKAALVAVGLVALTGAGFATVAYNRLTPIDLRPCLAPHAAAAKSSDLATSQNRARAPSRAAAKSAVAQQGARTPPRDRPGGGSGHLPAATTASGRTASSAMTSGAARESFPPRDNHPS